MGKEFCDFSRFPSSASATPAPCLEVMKGVPTGLGELCIPVSSKLLISLWSYWGHPAGAILITGW